MKIHHTKLLNKECILVEMPKDAKGYNFAKKSYYTGKNSDSNKFQLITGDETIEFENVEFINFLSEITDEDVETLPFKAMQGQHYKNYAEREKPRPDYTKLWCRTPLESFFSALEAEGLFLNGNPIPFPEETLRRKEYEESKEENPNRIFTIKDSKLISRWNEAETRTFDKTRTILLIKN